MSRPCKNCHKPADVRKTVIRHNKIFEGCEHCIDSLVQGNETIAQHKREAMKRTYAQDIVQPGQPRDFIKANPEKAKELYSPEVYRKFS